MSAATMDTRSEQIEDEATRLQKEIIAFIRAFGLLRPDATPCGRSLSVSEAHALLELSRGQDLSQVALGQRLRLEKSTVSRLITQLREQGWVARTRDPVDGRVVRLRLTEQGRHVAEQVAAARSAHFARLTERIPADEREAVAHAFRVVVQALEGQVADSPEDDGRTTGNRIDPVSHQSGMNGLSGDQG